MSVEARPADRAALAAHLAEATRTREPVRITGGGSSSRRGLPMPGPPRTVSTTGLREVVVYEPADLTVTVEAGLPADALHLLLAERGQSWPQADRRPGATVGGILATAATGHRRLRDGAVRDSLLEVVLCTGDGRLVKAGGRTVKGVAGFDLCRLAVGSLGTLGVIVEVTLKLWPVPLAAGWFSAEGDHDDLVAHTETVRAEVHRPACVLRTPGRVMVERVGPEADVVAPSGFRPSDPPPRPAWTGTVEVGVPPTALHELCAVLSGEGLDHAAQIGVGICHVGVTRPGEVAAVRAAAIALGGHAQVVDAPDAFREDPWGPPPATLPIMRRLRRSFDPAGILNPGMFIGDATAATPAGVRSAP